MRRLSVPLSSETLRVLLVVFQSGTQARKKKSKVKSHFIVPGFSQDYSRSGLTYLVPFECEYFHRENLSAIHIFHSKHFMLYNP